MPRHLSLACAAIILSLTPAVCVNAADAPAFQMHELDSNVGNVCYALAVADVDGDGKSDLVAVTESRVVWYHNPTKQLRVIVDGQTEKDNVCIAPHDIDGDGKIDFALGAGWLNGKNLGTIQWLSRGSSLDDKWHVHAIASESWLHRMRWGDILGTGKPQLVISPLNKTVSPGVRVMAFEVPANPKTDPWKAKVLDETMNAMHNHWMGDFDGDGRTDVITAAQEGVFLIQSIDGRINKTQIGQGSSGEKPTDRGAGEVKVGKLKGNRRFVVTVEPMHGNAIAVYTEPGGSKQLWKRNVIDDTLKRGHAIGVADMDGDGNDELVIGHSDKGTGTPTGPGVFLYDIDDIVETGKGTKHVIDDGGIATEDLVIEDFDHDGRPDIAAGGRATHNVRLYINRGR